MNAGLRSPAYRVLGSLLEYPDAPFRGALPEIRVAVETAGFATGERDTVGAVVDWMSADDALEMEALYVRTFDLDAGADLHLTSHLSADGDRNRGPALIRLAAHFEQNGWTLATRELPDYLPLLLEFTATLEERAARRFLMEAREGLNAIAARLAETQNPYLPLLQIIAERARPIADARENAS